MLPIIASTVNMPSLSRQQEGGPILVSVQTHWKHLVAVILSQEKGRQETLVVPHIESW